MKLAAQPTGLPEPERSLNQNNNAQLKRISDLKIRRN